MVRRLFATGLVNEIARLGHFPPFEPRLDHGVDRLRRLLLDPVRDTGEIAEGQITHELVGAEVVGVVLRRTVGRLLQDSLKESTSW